MCGRGRGQAQVGGGGRGPVPGPAGRLAVEHPQLVVDTVRGHLVMAALLLLGRQVTENTVDRGDLEIYK